MYFHPSTRTNRPVINRFAVAGDGWEAELTFGYAPDEREREYEELGLSVPTKFHPYHVSLQNQGLDVILHERVILFHQLSELGWVARHNSLNRVRGEIDLKRGFSTAITKNSMANDEHYVECTKRIGDILKGETAGPEGVKKNYLGMKSYPEEIPEELLRDRLAKWLASNPMQPRHNVKTEYVVQGIEGYIDILADNGAWELKTDQARALDVYQLFMYMDVGNIEKGFLVAKEFTTGARTAAEHVQKSHNKDLVLAKIEQFPISSPPTEVERREYF